MRTQLTKAFSSFLPLLFLFPLFLPNVYRKRVVCATNVETTNSGLPAQLPGIHRKIRTGGEEKEMREPSKPFLSVYTLSTNAPEYPKVKFYSMKSQRTPTNQRSSPKRNSPDYFEFFHHPSLRAQLPEVADRVAILPCRCHWAM